MLSLLKFRFCRNFMHFIMKNILTIILISVVYIFNSCKKDSITHDTSTDTRRFYMGFTPFPYDITQQAVDDTYQNIINDGDLVLIHFDNGVPWNEALNDLPFPANVQYDINKANTTIPADHKIFLTLTPNHIDRETLAHYWNDNGTQQDLPASWNTYSFNHPDVISAYIKYCKRMIDAIHPDYFAYGIEVNGGLRENTANYDDFVVLADTVYTRLKHDYPGLPVMMTFQDQSYNKTKAELIHLTRNLMAYSDYMAVSTYPFWLYDQNSQTSNPDDIPQNWLTEMHDIAPQKPFVISETGYIAENLIIPSYQVNIQGQPDWQKKYTRKLCQKANELQAVFICWFIYQDYDLMYQHLNNPPPYFLVWKDNGMLDGTGQARPALNVWREWLNKNKSF